MVVKSFLIALVAAFAIGCGNQEEASTQRAAPLTIDEQIAKIEKRTDMPDAVKQQTIASLRQQQSAAEARK